MKRTLLSASIIGIAISFLVALPAPVDAQTAQKRKPLSVKESILLAGNNLCNILNPEEHYLPYWELTIQPNYRARLSRGWPAHNLGRWLDAMMRAEESVGQHIPSEMEKAMTENVMRFFDNPDCISLNPDYDPFGGYDRQIWDLHSLREGMLALNALARYRHNEWAVETGERMIESLNAKLKDDGTWDLEQFDAYHKRGPEVIHNLEACDTHGRMLEAVIWFYETTGSEKARQFADRVARWHFAHTTQEDGKINPDCRADHTHSYLGTLRGLLLYGRLTGQPEYIKRVADAYRTNVPVLVKPSGYTSHNMAVESFGETTSPGDAVQLALWLYEEGYPEFLDDADRLVRCRILPSQIVEAQTLIPFSSGTCDAWRDLERRMIGAYGGCHYHSPHGSKMPVTDVTSADVHTMVDVYRHIAVTRPEGIEVLLHQEYEDENVRVETAREEQGMVRVTMKREGTLAIRIPQWVPDESIQVTKNGKKAKYEKDQYFARLKSQPAGTVIELRYALPEYETKETDQGVEYTVYWKGDDVVGISPNTSFFPLFPDAPAK